MPSFSEFVAAERVGHKKCWTCNHPRCAEINAARHAGGTIPQIVRWLKSEGIVLSEGALNNHFSNAHDVEVSSSSSVTLPLKRKSG